MSTVVLQSLQKVYDEGGKNPFHAVKGIDLEIEQGEFMVFVGPSGCGKSTTLRMIAGLESITGGELRIGDRVMNRVAPKDRGVAMVFQNYALYPHMSVFDNMAFGLKIRKQPRQEIEKRVSTAAETLGLAEMLDRKPGALSGGQRQRVALGRAIVREPDVFLFDEPLSNLDAKMRVEMRSEILAMHRRVGATMIYVTHDQVEAMTMGQRICLMNEGEIVQVDRPLDLYHQPNSLFSAGFIGSPPMNLIDGHLVGSGEGIEFRIKNFSLPVPSENHSLLRPYLDRSVHLGFRPEGVALSEDLSGETLRGQVDFSEAMGAETIVHLRLDGSGEKVSARIAGDQTFALGQSCGLGLNVLEAHWFDPKTGKAIRSDS